MTQSVLQSGSPQICDGQRTLLSVVQVTLPAWLAKEKGLV